MIVVSDTSPISNLILIGRLQILESLFSEVVIPPHVHSEVMALSELGTDLSIYVSSPWIKVIEPKDQSAIYELETSLDKGESEAIVLATELKADLLLIYERAGTRKASQLGLTTIGLLGVLIEAKNSGLVAEIKIIVEQLEKEGFWIGEKLKQVVLERANEI